MPDNELRQRIHDLRRQSREEHLELMGIKLDPLRTLEKKYDDQFVKLANEVKRNLKKAGGDVVKVHDASRARTEILHQKEVEGVFRRNVADLDRVRQLLCYCFSFNTAAAIGCGHDPAVISPPAGGTGSASAPCDATGSNCHPLVDAKGQGTGTTNSAEITSHCRFSFTPSSDGTYCINPLVYMNGHYLAWTWGACGGTAEDLGHASVTVELTVQIDQLSVPIKTINHTVIDHSVSTGTDIESGFAYDSAVDGGASTHVILLGGHETVVWVKCRCFAEVVNHGRAWVDMQTSPQFYFKIDHVNWGPVICWPWWSASASMTALPS